MQKQNAYDINNRETQLEIENKKLQRENWWLKAFAVCVIIVQLYDMLHK